MTPPERQPQPAAVQEQFARLVSEQRRKWMTTAIHILGDRTEAEDLVQETLALVWRRIGEELPANLAAYLAKAVRMNALKRRARRKQWTSLDYDPIDTPDVEDTIDIDPDVLEQAINDLPQSQQAVIRMKYYAGMTFRQIAESMSLSINTVASRCRYALSSLRQSLSKHRGTPRDDMET